MIVYKSTRQAVRRYGYGESGIVDTIGSFLARQAMLITAARSAMRDTLNVAKKAIQHLIEHEVATNIQNATSKKRKKVEIDPKRSQDPQLKKAAVNTGGIGGSGIVLD